MFAPYHAIPSAQPKPKRDTSPATKYMYLRRKPPLHLQKIGSLVVPLQTDYLMPTHPLQFQQSIGTLEAIGPKEPETSHCRRSSYRVLTAPGQGQREGKESKIISKQGSSELPFFVHCIHARATDLAPPQAQAQAHCNHCSSAKRQTWHASLGWYVSVRSLAWPED